MVHDSPGVWMTVLIVSAGAMHLDLTDLDPNHGHENDRDLDLEQPSVTATRLFGFDFGHPVGSPMWYHHTKTKQR